MGGIFGTGIGPDFSIGRGVADLATGGLYEGYRALKPKGVSNAPAVQAQQADQNLAGGFAKERNLISPNGQLVQVKQGYIDPVRQQQNDALGLVRSAALGQTPSAAEIAGANMANRAAAQQFGMASALGGRSPGTALVQASNGAANIQGQNIADTAALRAKEQADARDQLVRGLGAVRGQEQDLGTTNANLNLSQQQMLLAAQLRAQGLSDEMIATVLGVNTKNAAATNAFNGGLIQTGAQAAPLLA